MTASLQHRNINVKIHRTIIMPDIFNGFETWSLTLRKVYSFLNVKVCENKVLRRIFVPKRDEVTREWGRLHNEELYALYC